MHLGAALPVGEYLAVALLVWFGIRSIKSALSLPAGKNGTLSAEAEESGELAEAEQFVKNVEVGM